MVVTILSDFQIIPCFFAWQVVPLPTAIIYIRSMILETEIDGLHYSLVTDKQEATLKKCVDIERTGEVVIPASFFYQGIVYKVTRIGYDAFVWRSSLTAITIPEGVTSIEYGAFKGCRSLERVTINCANIGNWFSEMSSIKKIVLGKGVTRIETYAFRNCSGLATINIPESVKSIGYGAFYGCHRLECATINCTKVYNWFEGNRSIKEIILGESVTSIEYRAFYECSNLTSINIPEGVTSIGGCAFLNCSSLTTINIPESVTSIGVEAFAYCYNLIEITVGEGNPRYDSREGCNAIIETASNTLVAGCNKTIIPESVTSIGYKAFFYCRNLTSINIPKGVTSIGEGTFAGCSSLTSLTILEGVTSIGDGAFYGCCSLTSINIPMSVTSIGDEVFAYCDSLTSINIPKSVTSIGEGVFGDCSSLERVTINCANVDNWFKGNSCIKEIILGESVTSIGWNAFRDCKNLTTITIPEGVTSIGDWAFSNCSSLAAITIPKGVTSIGSCAFSGCSSLTAIIIPKGVTSIGVEAFSGCSSLNSILIPKGIRRIGYGAFKYSGITYLTILGKPTTDEEAFDGCEKLTDVYCYSEEEPPAEEAFGNLDLSCITLHVPEKVMEQYKNTEPWSRFGTIVAIK